MADLAHVNRFQDLLVYQKSRALATEIQVLTGKFPRDEIYALTSQIQRAAVSVCSNIAEGHGRGTAREFSMFLRNANGSLKEVETQPIIANKLRYIDQESTSAAVAIVEDVGRMLHGLIK